MSRNILLSGAAQGIGRCLARHFLEAGNRVFIVDVNEEELKYCATVHLKKHASNLSYAICNLRDVSAIREMVKKAVSFFDGRIDVLVNNGGISSPKWKEEQTMENPDTMEQWIAYVETNLTATFAVSQACIPHMKIEADKPATNPGPCIINITSFRAHQSDANQEGYAATKLGQEGLTRAMAISGSQWGIRVNSVAPGRIKVMHECKEGDEQGKGPEMTEADVEQHPTHRAGRPEDIADAVQYLVGAGFVTGQDLVVDGGVLTKK